METTLLPVDSIRTDAGTQMRAAQSAKAIDEYVENLAKLPPITVFLIDGTYVLVDGFHRLAAYKQGDHDTIPCIVLSGTLDDAREYACCANQGHGVRRSDEDKYNAVEEFFNIPGRDALTNSEAGRRLGLSTPFVKKVRDELGVKASPAAHMGAGSAKRQQSLNGLIKPASEKAPLNGLKRSALKAASKIVNAELPDNNKQEFAAELLRHFDPKYLKSCVEYLRDVL